jgi:hypothetical protein
MPFAPNLWSFPRWWVKDGLRIGQIESAKSLRAEFKYVKIKQLKELNSYLKLCDPIFSKEEVARIADFLVEKGK